jgi:hypothetical protein
MVYNLEFALALSERRSLSEIVVSKGVFVQALRESRRMGENNAVLNARQARSSFFINKAKWRGVVFIHCSREEISD